MKNDSHRRDSDRRDSDRRDSHRRDNHRRDNDRRDSHGKDSYERGSYIRDNHGKNSYERDSHRRNNHERDSYERDSHRRDGYERDSHGRQNRKPDEMKERKGKDETTSEKGYSSTPGKHLGIKPKKDSGGNLDMLEGRNPVIEAIKAGRSIDKILIAKGEREGSIIYLAALAAEKKIVLQEVDRAKLDKLSVTGSHQGVVAYVSVKEYVEVEDILDIAAAKGEDPFILILDGITDAHNLGAILRTADACGVHGIIIPKRRAIGLNAAVAKASAGAVEYVPVARVTNIAMTLGYLKSRNIWVAGTDSTGNKSFQDVDLKGAIAIVIGSEGEGVRRLVGEACDFIVNIPMKGHVNSLNASVAAALMMYEVSRQRKTREHER